MILPAMAKGKLGHGVDICGADAIRPSPGRMGPGGAQPHQVCP